MTTTGTLTSRQYWIVAAIAGALLLLLVAYVLMHGPRPPTPTLPPLPAGWSADGSYQVYTRLMANERVFVSLQGQGTMTDKEVKDMAKKLWNIRGKIATAQWEAVLAASAASAAGESASTVRAARIGDYTKPNERLDEVEQYLAAFGGEYADGPGHVPPEAPASGASR